MENSAQDHFAHPKQSDKDRNSSIRLKKHASISLSPFEKNPHNHACTCYTGSCVCQEKKGN